MAHTKAGKTTKGSRNSQAKRLGLKKFGGESVIPGNIILRQRGTKFHPGEGTMLGKDYTIFSITTGIVNFIKRKGNQYITVQPKP